MVTTERIIEGLPEETQRLLQAYSKDVKGVFGDQLEGLILYGSAVRGEFMPGRSNLNLLLVVTGYDTAMLKRYEPVHKRWSKEGIIIPLFLTDQEIRTSSALFPLEFLEIQEHHRVLGGRDPFVGFHVDVSRVADAVKQGLAGHVLRLRQRFAETGGANDAVMILLPLAVTSTTGMIKRLGGRAWNRLHSLVYAVGVLAALHFFWLAKKARTEPYWYALVLAVLLGSLLAADASNCPGGMSSHERLVM